jgi:hypothetical protein
MKRRISLFTIKPATSSAGKLGRFRSAARLAVGVTTLLATAALPGEIGSAHAAGFPYACQDGSSKIPHFLMSGPSGLDLEWFNDDDSVSFPVGIGICAGAYEWVLQSDGNFVIYNESGKAVWASGTDYHSTTSLVFQNDGNFVDYFNGPMWATGTNGNLFDALCFQEDGNMVIYAYNVLGCQGKVLWASNT